MYHNDILHDKPDPRAIDSIKDQLNKASEILYFGDDLNIDKTFASNIKAKFYFVNDKTNYLLINK